MRSLRIIVSIFLLVASLGLGLLLLWPTYQELSQLRAQVKEVRERLERGEAVVSQLKEVRGQVEMHQEDFAKMSIGVPQEVRLPAVYDLVQDLGSSSGVLVQAIEANTIRGDEEREGGVAITELNLQVSGSYEGLKSFLGALRRSARILNVQSVRVDVSETEEGASILDIAIEMNVYSYEK